MDWTADYPALTEIMTLTIVTSVADMTPADEMAGRYGKCPG
jgi:hypothetical protein